MTFSNSSFLMSLLFSNILLILLYFLFRNTKFLLDIGYRLLAVFLVITLLRFLLPFEIACSTNILLPKALSDIIIFFKTPNIVIGKHTLSVWHIFLMVWLAGSCLALIQLLLSYHRFHRNVRILSTDISSEEPYRSLIKQICREHHRGNHFHIVRLSGISSPMVTGILKPYILLPDNLDADRQNLYYILSHEAAHIFHHDLLLKLLSQILCVIYWWNPFVRLLRKQITTILELRIDLQLTDSPDPQNRIGYLDCLLHVAKLEQSPAKAAISLCNSNESLLTQRFSMIMNHSQKKSRRKQIVFSLLFVGLYAFSIFFIFEPYSISPEDEEGTYELTSDDMILEDAYLIKNTNGDYDLYIQNQYIATTPYIETAYSELTIYESQKEVPKNEVH